MCALVTVVQTCSLPISIQAAMDGDQDAVLVRIVVSIHGCLDSALVKNDYRGLSGLILAFECANNIGENFDLAAGSKESHHLLSRSKIGRRTWRERWCQYV